MVNPQLVRMSQETGIELVATNDVHYTYAEDAEAHDICSVSRPERNCPMRTVCATRAASIM